MCIERRFYLSYFLILADINSSFIFHLGCELSSIIYQV